MLRLNRFEYLAPTSLPAAVQLLECHGQEAALMAGGTDVLVNIKHRLVTPRYLVSIRRLPELREITQDDDGWTTIGAGVSLTRLERDDRVRLQFPALAHAAHLVSTPQVRMVGTIGGNLCLDKRCNYYNQSYEWRKGIGFCLKKDSPICRVAPGGDRCWAVASADTVPVLIALGAEVTIHGPAGTRRILVEHLHTDDGLLATTLGPAEIVSAVHLPPANERECVYEKFRIRGSFDFPLAAVAVAVDRDSTGIVCQANVILTGVAAYPERAKAAESALVGNRLEHDTIEAAGSAVYRVAKPMDNTAGSIFHRKRMARVLTERGLLRVLAASE